MERSSVTPGKQVVIAKAQLQVLFDRLKAQGYTLLGPTVRHEVIVYDEIAQMEDLPVGWRDQQAPASYRLQQRDDDQFFGYAVGPQSWKKFLFPASLRLFGVSRNGQNEGNGHDPFTVQPAQPPQAPRYAFVGVRGCEMAAINVQDSVFLQGAYVEPHYEAVRENAFLLGVSCTAPAATCFCSSMGAGPHCSAGCDLSLTELQTTFLVDVGSELGGEMLAACDWRPAAAFDLHQARTLLADAEARMARAMQTDDLPQLFYENLDHPRWDDVAARCLSCANCTMVCPTCFCHTVEDASDLSGAHTERVRLWDSCFNPDFSYVHGGNLRPNTRARYRQWLTHKLASWIDQFGTSGCVGCGRCITWCPVGIDLTEEVAAIRGTATAIGDGANARRGNARRLTAETER